MQKEFLNHLSSGYKNRKYDLDKRKIEKFIDSFFRFVFFLEYQRCNSEAEIHLRLESFKLEFQQIINSVIEDPDMKAKAASCFFEAVPHVYNLLEKDAQFILDNDPAATHIEEVMVSYPGFYAISIYRFAHLLHLQGVP
ncbi:MAG: serine acetyltransferase, partial [Riemerella sp.]|nr:serine acetyltransferase [Riemerella sp.]